MDPTANRIYVANHGSNDVSVINGASNTVVATVAVGSGPWGVAVNASTNLIYVANPNDDNVTVIDGAGNVVGTPVPVGIAPVSVAVNPNTNLIYVANYNDDNVSVINGDTNAVVATVAVGSSPLDVAVNASTNRIYVANSNDDNVSVINGDTNAVVATVAVGTGPWGVAVNPNTNLIYAANNASDNVSVIDGASNTVVATVALGSDPFAVAVNPSRNRIYVANQWDDSVSVIDGASNTVVATVAVGSGPWAVAVNPTTNRIYTANHGSNDVSVIEDMPPPPTFTVNSTADTPDSNLDRICDDGAGNCTLRAAIQEANYIGGADINFSITNGTLFTITLTSALPTITEAVTIDATTQPGAGFIELDGGGLNAPGLHITAGNSIVRGLFIHGFTGNGIVLETGGGNLIQDNVIVQNGGNGVTVTDAKNTTIASNTISANSGSGVYISGAGATGNLLQGNIIGLSMDGTTAMGNGGNGVTVTDAKNTTIARNTISANSGSGVYISGAGATGNLLTGNVIGADAAGTLDRGNAQDGVRIAGAPDNSVGVGSSDPQTGNIISGNDGAGVHISGAGAQGNKVQHNGIGVQLDLKSPLGNGSHGVWIYGSNNNLVGGTALYMPPPAPGNFPEPWVVPNTLNTIAHNGGVGVFVDNNSNGNSIRANNIYDNGALGIDVYPPGHSSPFSDDKVTSALWSATHVLIGGQWVLEPLVISTGYIRGGWANTGVVVEAFISSNPDPTGFGEGEKWVAGGNGGPGGLPIDPPPFYIDAGGNMSAAGSIRSGDAKFVPGQYLTDTVTNIQDGHPQKGTTLEFSNSAPIVADSDGDGIADGLDDQPLVYSNFFSDATSSGGTTSGNIVAPNYCLVSVVDLPYPDGVVLGATCSVNPDGTTTGPAQLTVCGGRTLDLPTSTSTFLKCGSADFSVGYGPLSFGVGTMKARLPTGAKVHFSNPVGAGLTADYTIVNDITSPTIWVGGVLIGPGKTVTVRDTDGDGMADPAAAAVGGIAEAPDVADANSDASASDSSRIPIPAEVAAALAVSLVALGVGGWYARRRWHNARSN